MVKWFGDIFLAEMFNWPAGVFSLPVLRREGGNSAIKVRKFQIGRSGRNARSVQTMYLQDELKKRREKRFSCIYGIIKRIYFLINSHKELAFGLVGMGVLKG